MAMSSDPSYQAPRDSGRYRISVTSSMDGTEQPSYLILPPGFEPDGAPVPVVVSLHTWSGNLEQRNADLEAAVGERGWIYLFPDFRGVNDHAEACASELSRRDVIDALDWVMAHYPVDAEKVYLTGMSGGGYMTLAMVERYPDRWTAASAWVPLSDLRSWYDFHARDGYGEMTRSCVGGDPGKDPGVVEEMIRRSPIHQLSQARDVAIDINAGRFDGHNGASIPVWHSLAAFNAIAESQGASMVSDTEIAQMSRHDPRLDHPLDGDEVYDAVYDRRVFLRRTAGKARVTIFDGAHEGIAPATVAWFDDHPTR
ncbi:MAG: prolyl oligopeptidase family serine peptidase [Candidatus Latescibacteria bacterium]|nr:prolyl oligopeptidase family serine peptidase [Candidatus Latescibacterota bacterium]